MVEDEGSERTPACLKWMRDPLAGGDNLFTLEHNVVVISKVHTGKPPSGIKKKKNHPSSQLLPSRVGGIFIAPLRVLTMCAMNQTGKGATKRGFFSLSGFQEDQQGDPTAQPMKQRTQQDEPPRLPINPNTIVGRSVGRGHRKKQEVMGMVALSCG